MKKRALSLVLATGAFVAISNSSQALVTFYFANKGTTTPVTSLDIGLPGSTFDLTVCMVISGSTFPHSNVDTFIGFDRTNLHDPSATPMDMKIGLNGSPSSAISSYDTTHYPSQFTGLGGGQTHLGDPANAIRPYGVDVSLSTSPGTEVDPGSSIVKLYNISFSNLNLHPGESYTLSFWDAEQGLGDTSYIANLNGDVMRPEGSSGTLIVDVPVPEPMSFAVLGIGATSLLLRRRKR